jgi:hypothetical protein
VINLTYLNQPLGKGMESKVEQTRKKTGGRSVGTPNKSTALAREAIAKFVDGNSHKLQEWLDEIAMNEKLGPKVAFDCFMQVAEYHVPKLARTEQVGDETAPVVHIYKWQDD